MKLLHLVLKFNRAIICLTLAFTFTVFNSCLSFDLSQDTKDLLKQRFKKIIFKIDNSFSANYSDTYLPLISQNIDTKNKLGILFEVEDILDKEAPKLIWLSNDLVFVKLLKKANTTTILDLKEVPENYRSKFKECYFPEDLVVPKGFLLSTELSGLAGSLPIELIEKQIEIKTQKKVLTPNKKIATKPKAETKIPVVKMLHATSQQAKIKKPEPDVQGTLYLTSPDTGKIVFLDLSDIKKIDFIQTMGAPWKLAFNKITNTVFVSDFAKDKIYHLKPKEKLISELSNLPSMSSPRDIAVSDDGSIIYIISSVSNDFSVYKIKDTELLAKTKLPTNPNSFAILDSLGLIAITFPAINDLAFIKEEDFLILNKLRVEGNPEKIIQDPVNKVFYVTNRTSNNISVIDPEKNIIKSEINVGETPTAIAINSSLNKLYVANGKSNSISVIDLDKLLIVNTINLPIETQFPGDIELTKDKRWLIVTSETTNIISIIDLSLNQVKVKLDVGATTHDALIL